MLLDPLLLVALLLRLCLTVAISYRRLVLIDLLNLTISLVDTRQLILDNVWRLQVIALVLFVAMVIELVFRTKFNASLANIVHSCSLDQQLRLLFCEFLLLNLLF